MTVLAISCPGMCATAAIPCAVYAFECEMTTYLMWCSSRKALTLLSGMMTSWRQSSGPIARGCLAMRVRWAVAPAARLCDRGSGGGVLFPARQQPSRYKAKRQAKDESTCFRRDEIHLHSVPGNLRQIAGSAVRPSRHIAWSALHVVARVVQDCFGLCDGIAGFRDLLADFFEKSFNHQGYLLAVWCPFIGLSVVFARKGASPCVTLRV